MTPERRLPPPFSIEDTDATTATARSDAAGTMLRVNGSENSGAGATVLVGGLMKLFRTTALTAALMTAAIPSLTTSADAAWGWRGGGWGWGGVGVGLAAGALIGGAIAASSYGYGYGYPAYGYGYGYPAYGYGYGYPAYGYGAGYGYAPAYGSGYGTGYSSPAYRGYASHPLVRRHVYATTAGVRRH